MSKSLSNNSTSECENLETDNLIFGDILELWRDPPNNNENNDNNDNDNNNNESDILNNDQHLTSSVLPNILSQLLDYEIRTTEMSNLAHLLIDRSDEFQEILSDPTTSSLSLSQEHLTELPQMICQEFGPYVRTLDLSSNEFRNLNFLKYFTELTSLIIDRNPINSSVIMPWMPKLELLYLNYCYIEDFEWIDTLSYNCPHLKYLSLMGNPVAPSELNGGSKRDHLEYRMHVIGSLPNLLHLDDQYITIKEKEESRRMYPKCFLDSISEGTRSCMPNLLRSFRLKMKDKCPTLKLKKIEKCNKNCIV